VTDTLTLAGILLQVLVIDLVLAGDNAIVIGLAVNGLAPAQRRRAIIIGIGAATILRIGFALVALRLLAIIGLTLAGGILLLWVVWKSARELRESHHASVQPTRSLAQAIQRIVIADLSMSLDNVLAVAGAARAHPLVLALGLVVSVGLMGLGASLVARILVRYPWVAWIGIAIVAYVALAMVHQGGAEVLGHYRPWRAA
jgi:YjbE family integral membrane protein